MTAYELAMTATTVVLAGCALYLATRVEHLRKSRDQFRAGMRNYFRRLDEIDQAHSEAVAAGSLARTLHHSARHLEVLAENTEDPEERKAAQVYHHAVCSAKNWAMRNVPANPEFASPLPE